MSALREDLQIIQQWVQPDSQVLDLGCGEGTLLKYLQQHKNVRGYGLEIDPDKITACIANGVNVIEQDLDKGLSNFSDNSIDTVVMTQALQAVQRPDLLLDEMLRIGDEAIVTFPNFGYWRTRFYLLLKGRMPMSETLPYNWYDTPNIHMCTFRDFEVLCHAKHIRILNRTVVDDRHREHWTIGLWPAMLGEIAVYHITRK
ncbi:methionine biosynthesis protein MetW [Venatoribacter cucullus]|uniref:methionine biosynthesis protein MetW n=1 Tax=Venatoribacter cucullus TaxID=2661630 RepID=UPI002240049F|nr:methionine biosynthesis protein MetW [Venatoribacter cucullus]UZK02514.1 methionine biosynthesis protein MetW [Venatoribacter cucullus]